MLYLRNELLPEISVFFLLVFFLGGGSRNPVVSCNINYNKGLKTQERKTIDDKQESLGLCYFVKHHPHASTTAQVLLKCCSSAAQVPLKCILGDIDPVSGAHLLFKWKDLDDASCFVNDDPNER